VALGAGSGCCAPAASAHPDPNPDLPSPRTNRHPQEMLQFASVKGIKPMVEIYKLSDINAAMERVASGKARYRVVMETDL